MLEDGTVFHGYSFGYSGSISGEVVFNTGMVGYVESLTDPSYKGQILVATYPLIGNYGVPPDTKDELGLAAYYESERIHVSGLIVSDYSFKPNHWQSNQTLSQWLINSKVRTHMPAHEARTPACTTARMALPSVCAHAHLHMCMRARKTMPVGVRA